MSNIMKAAFLVVLFLIVRATLSAGRTPDYFSPYVDSEGTIALPLDFRSTWVHLGTWLVTSQVPSGSGLDQTAPGSGFHNVYTQPDSVKGYRKSGAWPDGTFLVKEIRTMKWDDLPTGHVIFEGKPVKWLVMVKDSKERFRGKPNWGDGWGWALFKATDQKRNASTNYEEECLSCHEPLKATDYVFIRGYPTLRMEAKGTWE